MHRARFDETALIGREQTEHGSRPNAWCSFKLTRLISALRRIAHVPGTAESMMIGLSLNGAIVSSVMYRAR